MKTKVTIMMGFVALLLTMAACSNDTAEQTAPVKKEIQLSAQVAESAVTRTTYEHIFTNAVCWVWADNVDEVNGSVLENGTDYLKAWRLTANRNGVLTPASDDKKLWPDNGNLNFYVMVGNAGDSFVKNETAFPSEALTHTIAEDQRTEAAYNSSDLMFGSLAGVTSVEYPTLQLQHMLSQVQVALIAGGDISKEQLATATLELVDMPTSATVTLSKSTVPTVAADVTTANTKMRTIANVYSGTYQYASAIVAPHSHSGHFVKLTYDSQVYYYDRAMDFANGHTYRLNLTLKDKCIVALTDIQIQGWSSGENVWAN